MSKDGTVSFSGWYAGFRANVLRQLRALKKSLAGVLIPNAEVKSRECEFLKLISGSKRFMIDATDGKNVLADAKDTFAYIDPNFRNWGASEKGPATEKTPVAVYEMVQDGTFSQMFGSLSSDVRKLCLTQAQIKGFVKDYCRWLQIEGYETFLLFESNSHFFVAYVHAYSDGKLSVDVRRFGLSLAWGAWFRHRLVVPQLV